MAGNTGIHAGPPGPPVTRREAEEALVGTERQFRVLVNGVTDCSIYMLSPAGIVMSWNQGAARISGYTADEVIGRHFSIFFTHEDRLNGLPAQLLETALGEGRCETEGPRVRKDGSLFWANGFIDPIRDDDGSFVGFAKITRDISEKRKAEEKLYRFAHFDDLTGMPNRHSIAAKLDELLGAGRNVALVAMDLDAFARTVQMLGQDSRNFLLRSAGERILSIVGARGIVGHFGNDDFAAILPDVGDPRVVARICEQIVTAFRAPFVEDGRDIFITISAGAAIGPNHGETPDRLLSSANMALHSAKANGRSAHAIYHLGLRQAAVARGEFESGLRRALAEGELELHYQPKVRLADRRIVGAESLLRWRHPQRGLLGPGVFLPVLEASPLAIDIGNWALRTACAQAVEIARRGHEGFCMAVNLSDAQIRRGNLVQTVAAVLAETGVPPELLELEITENIVMHDAAVINAMRSLRETGVRIAFDDFGTGHASLSLLKRFPLTGLKIDQGFVRGMCDNVEDRAVVRALLDLSRAFGLDVTAEGVETDEQEALLRAMGCVLGQGFLYGRAMSIDDLLATLADPPKATSDIAEDDFGNRGGQRAV